jgi:hypothetical protein
VQVGPQEIFVRQAVREQHVKRYAPTPGHDYRNGTAESITFWTEVQVAEVVEFLLQSEVRSFLCNKIMMVRSRSIDHEIV